MSEELLLSASGVRKAYHLGKRKLEVLNGIDLSIEAGEFVAMRGASGAGKSTLLHLLGGLDAPDQGEITFGRWKLTAGSRKELDRFRSREVGFVFQAYHLLPELDALENVAMPARIARMSAGEATERARSLLERVGLAQRMDHRPLEMSGGEQQRVAIARALMNSPRLILADEPTGNLDSATGDEIMRLLEELREEAGATLVIATHDDRLADRARRRVDLKDGLIAS